MINGNGWLNDEWLMVEYLWLMIDEWLMSGSWLIHGWLIVVVIVKSYIVVNGDHYW